LGPFTIYLHEEKNLYEKTYEKVMVKNNSINIKNTNIHFLSQIIEHKKDLEMKIQVLAWDRLTSVTGLNLLIRLLLLIHKSDPFFMTKK
jgi:hypothetical protein